MIQYQDHRFQICGAVADLFSCRAKEVLLEGPAGTGKTRGVLEYINSLCEQYTGIRCLMARATRVSMTESVLVTWENKVLWPGHPALAGSDASRAGRRNYTYPNGSEIVIGGCDNTERIMSAEYDIAYVAEATEISEEDWERILTRLRNAKMPYQQAIADCNPGPPGHWLNVRANRGQMVRLRSRHEDNPSVTPEYLRTLSQLTGHRRSRLYEGRWVAGSGSVYPEFSDRHQIAPESIPQGLPTYLGLDPGYDHPCAILWAGVDAEGRIFIYDELYRGGKSIAEHAADIKASTPGRDMRDYMADPQHAFSHTAQAPKSIAEQFDECGLTFSPWPRSTDKESMVNAVRDLLRDGKLFVSTSCQNTINEFQSWSYKRTSSGELPSGDDQFEDRDNHAMDVICGLVAAGIADTRPKVTVSTEPRTIRPGLDDVDWERERGPAGRPMAARAKQARGAVGMV